MTELKHSLHKFIPCATVFFSSACIMIIEITAGRLIARHLGCSLYTWTSVIGVVLAGISIGNYLGGRIADRFPAEKALSVLFGLSSAACVLVIFGNNLVGGWTLLWEFGWPMRVFSHVLLLFLLPSILLGKISPVVTKMALDQGMATGKTVGTIYAWGALGSIAGTFLAGFYLIAAAGTIAIIWTAGAALLLMAFLYWFRLWMLYIWAMIFIALATMGTASVDWAQRIGSRIGFRQRPDPYVLYEDDTQYCHVMVKHIPGRLDHRVFMQDKLKHSEIILEDIEDLRYFYTRIYAAVAHWLGKNHDVFRAMVIGGGGYVFPRYLERHWPESHIEVVEIDPGVTEAAIKAFGLSRDTSIRTVSMDGRNYVDHLLEKYAAWPIERYDVIYEDAINDYSVPFQLVTREFNNKIKKILSHEGFYVINLIDTYDNGRFLGAVINTVQDTFLYVHVMTRYGALSTLRDTYVVVACNSPFDPKAIISEYDTNLKVWFLTKSDIQYLKNKAQGIVLTDDYAPVENLLAPVVRQSGKEMLARRYLTQADRFNKIRVWHKAIDKYQQAVELNKSMSIEAYNQIGLIEVARGNYQQAIQAFQNAIDYNQQSTLQENAIASVHLNLGILLERLNKPQDAKQHLQKACYWFRCELRENPQSVADWKRLGDALATMGDFKEASNSFRQALELEPNNPSHYTNLAKSLEYQGRYDEAISVVRKHMMLIEPYGEKEGIANLRSHVELLRLKRARPADE